MKQAHTLEQEVLLAPTLIGPLRRLGPPPRLRPGLPRLPLDQWPPAEIFERIRRFCLELPHVRPQQSRMASPHTVALTLPVGFAGGPAAAFIDGQEFCHLHPLPEGSLHLMLPDEVRAAVIPAGWAERHPAARIGAMPEGLVLVYAPRDAEELDVVTKLIETAYRFARWGCCEISPDSGENGLG